MSKWIAEFELEDGDTMPEHMDLNYMGSKIDFHCRPKEPIIDKMRNEIDLETRIQVKNYANADDVIDAVLNVIDKYNIESEVEE